MMKYSVAICVAGMVAPGLAIAQQKTPPATTQWLYERCKSADSAVQDSCAAYLLGSAGMLSMLGKTYQNPPQGLDKDFVAPFGAVGICGASGDGATLRQVFINWAEKHPKERNMSIAQGVMTALGETWPCKSN